MRRIVCWLLGVFGVVLVGGTATVTYWLSTAAPGGPFPGTTLDLRSIDSRVAFGDFLELERRRRLHDEISLVGRFETITLTAEDVGLELDVGATLARARASRTHGGWDRIRRAYLAFRGRLDLVPVMRFDSAMAQGTLSRLGPMFYRPAVDARLDIAGHRRIRAEDGERLALAAMVDWLAAHLDETPTVLPAILEPVRPAITDAMLADVDVTRILSSYESGFRYHAGPRATNIRQAAKALNEVILPPGAELSFNQVVGPRRLERGYQMAPVIVDDELEPGVGGGVCQVASTLHAAAVVGGLEIVSRRSHSRPSGYVPLGLDATVIDGEVDLKLKNPYKVSLVIHTTFPSEYRLRVEILGMEPEAKLEYASHVTKRYETYRRVITHPELAAGTREQKQKGSRGYDVISTITAKYADGRVTTRHYPSKYFPVPEVLWVGPEVARESLPPLPEGAVAVTWDGTTVEGTLPKAALRRQAANSEPLPGDATEAP